MALPGRGGRALWCRTGFRGRAESGEHLGSRSEVRRDPVYGQLHFVRPWECRLLAGEQRRSFREGSVQAALGDMPGEVAQRLKKPLSLSLDLLMFPFIQLFFILSSLFILWGSLFILFFYSWTLFVVWFTFTALRLLNQFWKRTKKDPLRLQLWHFDRLVWSSVQDHTSKCVLFRPGWSQSPLLAVSSGN